MVSQASVHAPPRERVAYRLLWALRVVASGHSIAVFAQPVLAGMYLRGDYDMLGLHAAGADLVTYVGAAQVLVAAAYWWSARRWWPFAVSLALMLGETAQYFAGLAGALDLHVPLGVALVTGVAITMIALWLPRNDEPGSVR